MGTLVRTALPRKLLNSNLGSVQSFVNGSCVPNGGTAGLLLGSISAARSFFVFVFILLLRELRTPDLLSRLQALSPDLLLRGALASSDPCNSELCFFMAVLNYDLVSNLHLASITTQLHTMVADIESMREMAILTPGDPESYWHDRFGSLRPPFAYAKSRHVPRSLRVAAPDTDVFHAVHFRFSPNYCCALEILFLAGRCLRRRWIIPPLREAFRILSIAKRSGRGPSPLCSNTSANLMDSGVSSGHPLKITTGRVGCSFLST